MAQNTAWLNIKPDVRFAYAAFEGDWKGMDVPQVSFYRTRDEELLLYYLQGLHIRWASVERCGRHFNNGYDIISMNRRIIIY